MLSHPPIPVTGLNTHIEELKEDGASKFTAEYESIEPGQQFTWDNSSMDINKPKNRSENIRLVLSYSYDLYPTLGLKNRVKFGLAII